MMESLSNPDRAIRTNQKILDALKGQVDRLQKECENLKKETSTQNQFHHELSEESQGLRSASGTIFPLISFSKVNVENDSSKTTASFRVNEDIFSISLLCDDKQEVQKTELDLSKAPKLWEIRNHLDSLKIHNNPQSIIFDIVAFQELDKCRSYILSSLHHIEGKGFSVTIPVASDENLEASPFVKAYNQKTSEIYFELNWSIAFSHEYMTLGHEFLFKCIPQVNSDNVKIGSLILRLGETYWLENQSDLIQLWAEIYDWVKENASS